MAFRKIETGIPDLYVVEADRFPDARGYFMETYNQKGFSSIGMEMRFVQDNLSTSTKGVLRGLHFQAPPHAQGKLVSVLEGKVLDVAVDIRKSSSTYGQHFSIELDADVPRFLYVPEGFAHGFGVLSDHCIFAYKCTNFYNKPAEGGLMWNDPDLGIDWGIETPIISDKDKDYLPFREFESPFE